jgi:hypothetical protein
MCCFVPPFGNAKFCGVSSRAIVKVGCAMVKKGCGTLEQSTNLVSRHGDHDMDSIAPVSGPRHVYAQFTVEVLHIFNATSFDVNTPNAMVDAAYSGGSELKSRPENRLL